MRTCLLAGAVALAVPVLTLIVRPENRGGYNPEYAIDRIAVHWVAVAGVTLFVLALSRAMGRPARGRAAPPTHAARERPARCAGLEAAVAGEVVAGRIRPGCEDRGVGAAVAPDERRKQTSQEAPSGAGRRRRNGDRRNSRQHGETY